MSTIDYVLKKMDTKSKKAKIVQYKNNILTKSAEFPAVMFYVHSQEDINAIRQYYFQQYPDKYIFGFALPFDKLPSFVPHLIKHVPYDVTYMCDINTEVFWLEKTKPEVKRFYFDYLQIPDKIRHRIIDIGQIKKFKERIEEHERVFQEIVNNKSLLMSLITTYINRQNGYQVSILSGFSPLILDKQHLDLVEECYLQTKRFYHSMVNDIERDGKIIALFCNFHTNFLAKKPNIYEFVKMVERVEPKALIFKICNLKDIRERKTLQENYEFLIDSIGNISHVFRIPTFYLSTHTAGFSAQTKGLDIFCEPFYQATNNELSLKLRSETMKRMYEFDSLFRSGKIYDIKSGNLISRRNFQNSLINGKKADSLLSDIFNINTENIMAMTDKGFREFSKMYLMAARNIEQSELHKSIEDNTMNKIYHKMFTWFGPDQSK